jgi:hypothetical protein
MSKTFKIKGKEVAFSSYQKLLKALLAATPGERDESMLKK